MLTPIAPNANPAAVRGVPSRRRVLGAAIVAGLALTLVQPPAAQAAGTSEIALINTLDEPRGFCIDMVGSQESAQSSRPLQTHTCYDYQGSIAVDQGVTTAGVAQGSLRFPAFGVCVVGTGVSAGSAVALTPCGGSGLKAITKTKAGLVKPIASSSLCLTAGSTTMQGGGGSPVHLKRGLTWETCSAGAATRQRWTLRS